MQKNNKKEIGLAMGKKEKKVYQKPKLNKYESIKRVVFAYV